MSNDRLDKLEEKIDKIQDNVHSIDKTLVVNTESLQQHMKRSDALEDYVKAVETKLEPVLKRNTYIDGVMLFLGYAGSIAAFVYSIFSFFK